MKGDVRGELGLEFVAYERGEGFFGDVFGVWWGEYWKENEC